MENNKPQFLSCLFCNEAFEKNENDELNNIKFTCNHSICLKCYPYIFLNIICKKGIKTDFFLKKTLITECPFCFKGQTMVTFSKLAQILPSLFEKKNFFCDRCKKDKKNNRAAKECLDCELLYCENCFNWHEIKFEGHKINDIVLSRPSINTKKNSYCSCESNSSFKKICLNCNIATCDICNKDDIHEGHKFIDNFNEIIENSDRFLSRLNQKTNNFMEICSKKIKSYKENSLKEIKFIMTQKQKKMSGEINSIINELRKIESNFKESLFKEYQNFKLKLNLIDCSFDFINQEIIKNNKMFLHPNKKLFLMNNLTMCNCQSHWKLLI